MTQQLFSHNASGNILEALFCLTPLSSHLSIDTFGFSGKDRMMTSESDSINPTSIIVDDDKNKHCLYA